MELFHKILKTAVDGNASDIHIKIGTPVIFRINRELISIECPVPTEQWMNNVIEKLTPIHLKKKLEEEREVDFSYYIPDVGRFRTNLFQQRGQWALAMRYVRSHVASFEELGLLEQIKKIAEEPRGIVLVAGSTGCGKSTTLAAMIEHINGNFKKHIITLEDPIEFVFEDNQCVIEQREVGLDTVSFHPIVDLLSSYYLRSVEAEHMTRELFDILGASVSSGLFLTLPLCLLVTRSRHLRVRCESEVHQSDEALNSFKRLTNRLLHHWQRFRPAKPQPKAAPAKIPFITPLPPLPALIPTRFDRDSPKLPSLAQPTSGRSWPCLPKRGSLLVRLWPFSTSKR